MARQTYVFRAAGRRGGLVASVFGQRKLSRDGCGVSSKIFVKRKGLVEWKIKKKGGYIGCILICRTSPSFFARGEKRGPTSPPSEAEGGLGGLVAPPSLEI